MENNDIFTSKTLEAKKFQEWMFEEVLPSIMRTGDYTPSNPDRVEKLLKIFDRFYRNNPRNENPRD